MKKTIKKTNVRLPVDIYRKIVRVAKKNKRSINSEIATILYSTLDRPQFSRRPELDRMARDICEAFDIQARRIAASVKIELSKEQANQTTITRFPEPVETCFDNGAVQ